MIMNLLVIAIVLAMAYFGVLRHFFSSLLHMACVVIAGALAFAFWEPVTYILLEKAPTRGFFEFVEYNAWAIGLIVPFAASLAVLRVATDKLAPANALALPAADAVGGAICGAVTGVITAGILVIAIGTMQGKPDRLGYAPVRYTGASLQRSSGLWLPADRLVGNFYAHASEASFATANPLAKWRPESWHPAEVMRITDKGLGRNTAKPKDYSLAARYRVTAADGENLLQDRWANRPHDATMLDGERYPAAARIEGVLLKLETSLRERGGGSFTALTEGQLWMVATNAATGERLNLHPVAVIANPVGAETSLARFPFESPNFAVSSAGAASLPWAFEFVVPDGFEPIAVYLRNIRQELKPSQSVTEFASVADRDAAILDGSLIAGAEVYTAQPTGDGDARNDAEQDEYDRNGVYARNTLPNRRTIMKGSQKGLRITENNLITEGEAKFSPAELSERIVDRNLRIEKFDLSGDVVMVQVDVYGDKPGSMYGVAMAAANRVMPPQLEDTNALRYEAVGWVYEDRDMVHIRFTPGQPIRGLSELADAGIVLSSSRSDQKLTLLFLCTYKSSIVSFNVGPTEIFRFEEPLLLDQKQNR